MSSRQLTLAAAVLVAIQVIHGAVPADTSSEGYVGAVVGALLIIAGIVGMIGASSDKPWAPKLVGATGLFVAVGFLLYHVTPWHTPVTNPYFGEDKIGIAQWIPVFLCIAAGLWAFYVARERIAATASA
jgi:predicted amidohydrolase